MLLFSNFSSSIFIIVLALTVLPCLKAGTLLYTLIKTIIKTNNNLYRWKSGIISLEDLQHLTPKEFEYWCGEFIKKLGYTDIMHSKSTSKDGINILCKKFGDSAYIKCLGSLNTSNLQCKVDDDICKKLIGAMVHDGVTRGMIITSGVITNKAISFINTLPVEYKIELLDGSDIIKQYSYLHQKKYRTV